MNLSSALDTVSANGKMLHKQKVSVLSAVPAKLLQRLRTRFPASRAGSKFNNL
ncbi:hypothetical protein [Paenibacillus sp. S150]|uniref:hypothetical protein n=1 Tax=Paenibacillus sp. S150 TaxID=2749826 RepID=UPI001C573CD4|nr:hypothetical protein [Paenibacillus sp. S150]MBW4080763.1 hypothetical protein [Paenibacillus sp. S150]